MTLIAHVIVDVPTMQTDRPFSYLVPERLSDSIAIGMRVNVPFGSGNRNLQGFVVELGEEDTTTLSSNVALKEISEVLDLAPVLNQELLALADEMKDTTFSFKITCLETMLPSVMKAKYQKRIRLIDEVSQEIHDKVFLGLDDIAFEDAEKSGFLPLLMKLKKAEKVEVYYHVQTKNKSKKAWYFKSNLDFEALEEQRSTLSKQAKQKNRLLSFLQTLNTKTCSVKEAKEKYNFSRAILNAGNDLGWLILFEQEIYRNPFSNTTFQKTLPLKLNEEQKKATMAIQAACDTQVSRTFLLQGITGSGKTEVYLQTIAHVREQGKTAIMLVPEISLTPQTVLRFKSRFGDEVAVLHSGLSQGEKYDEWRKIERKEAHIVVGARSAIFAPLEDIGIIIIDEEHENSYKQEETPRYHARDLAIWRSQYHHCPVVLGSATPSLESRARAEKKVYQLLKLTKRPNHATLPEVSVVDMREEFKMQNTSTFSRVLQEKIKGCLERNEQAVLLLNRRGFSSFVMCRDCGYVLPCPNCDISLTLHMDTKSMKCHYCGHEEAIPQTCPKCGGRKIRYYGTGTQKVEIELAKLFPESRILRMDVDTTRRKGAHQKILDKFGKHQGDILLGTQMIAKGLDFPNVTLVGVLNADTALNLPDFRSSEKTFQLLTQVSGRAGRADKAGEVIIQSFNPEHYAVQLAKTHDYERFFRTEMVIRHQGNYPPYFFTTQITASHPEESVVAKRIFGIYQLLEKHLSNQVVLLGPSPKAILRINNRYFYQIVIKYKNEPYLYDVLKKIQIDAQKEYTKGLKISIDMEPMYFV